MGILLTEFKYGKIYISDKDVYIGKTLIHSGQYCDEEIDLLKTVLRKDDNVIEVGANIGCLSIPISQIIGDKGVLHAIEPQKYIFKMLCDNVSINNIKNITPKLAAIGDLDKDVNIPEINYESVDNFGGISIQENGSGEVVHQYTMDSLFDDLTSLRLIKIDVEGMEPKVVKGGLNLIKKHRPFIYCENDRPQNSYALLKLLTDCDYKVYKHISHVFNTPNFKGNSVNVFNKDYICTNVLAVPKELKFDCNLELLSLNDCFRWA
jgi:FkbM family methyltransferase